MAVVSYKMALIAYTCRTLARQYGAMNTSTDSALHHSGVLDPDARFVVNRLHALSKRQVWSLLPYYLPRLLALLMGRPFEQATKDMHIFDDKLLSIDAAQGDLLYLLARARQARCVVEFGTSFGVSTIYLAAAVRDAGKNGCVYGTELVSTKVAAARANIAKAGLATHASILEGDARQTLRAIEQPVDFLLLDGWPSLAAEILDVVEPKLADGAIVVLDNVEHFRSELGHVVDRMTRPPYHASILPLKNGTFVAVYLK